MTYIPIRGFAPDLEPTTPGVLLDCTNLVPTSRGMETRPSAVNTALAALNTACLGAATLRKLDGTTVTYAGTAASLFQAATTAWTEVSRSTSITYTAVIDSSPWRFAQFDDQSFATNKSDTLQATNASTGNFGDVSGGIKASIVETVGDFVMLFNTNDATKGDSPNRWWCSGIGNGTTFAVTLATQAASGTLAATPGAITAGRRLGNDIVAYKAKSMYLGRYVGPPVVWSWALITEEIGTPSQEAVVYANDAHYFLGPQDFYMYDGTRPVSIGGDLKEWFYENVDQDGLDLVRGYHEFPNSRVWWFFPSTGSTVLDSFCVYNYRTGRWGKGTITIETPVEFVGGGLTYDNFGSNYSTYNDAPMVPYNFPPWLSSSSFFGFFNSSHVLQTITGESSGSSLLTGWLGFDGRLTFGHRVRPRFADAPDSATLINRWQSQLGGQISSASDASTMIDGKFDFERSDRWHSIRMDFNGDMEIVGIDVEAVPDGLE